MTTSTIQVKVDNELKVNSDKLYRALGASYIGLSEEEILDKLAKSREYAKTGMYRDATEISHELRVKYEL